MRTNVGSYDERPPGRTGVCWRMVSRPPGYGVDTPTDCPEPVR